MEIGQETVDSFEWVRGINIGGGGAGVGAEVGGGFEDAGGGGADGDDTAGGGDFILEARADLVFFLVHGVIAKIGGFDRAKSAKTHVEGDESVGESGEELRGEVEAGGGGGDGAGDFGVGGLVGGDVGGAEIGLAVGFAGFEDVGGERGTAEGVEVKIFDEGADEELAAGDGFFDAEGGRGGRGALEGVGKEVGAGGESLGRGAEGGPPARAGFLEKEEFRAVLGADQAGGDDLGVVEDEEVVGLEQVGQIPDLMVLKGLGMTIEDKEAGRVAGVSGLGGDPIGGQGVGKKGGEGWGVGSDLTARQD